MPKPSRQVANPNPGEITVAMVPSDTVNQEVPFRAIYVGVSGNINVVFSDGSSFTFKNVPVGMFSHGGVRVNVTDTTASELGAVY